VTINNAEVSIDPLFVDFLDDSNGSYDEVVERNTLRTFLE
jgi:hypothetical protein